jgi:hypothetical protein
MVGANCFVCHQPLPLDQPVAFVEKQQVIHTGCYHPAPPRRRPFPKGDGVLKHRHSRRTLRGSA